MQSHSAEGRKKHVLWIEDGDGTLYDPLFESVSELLERLPARVSIARSGNEAVDFLLSQERGKDPVDLIIVDMHLPKTPGGEIDRKLGIKLLIDMNRQYNLFPESAAVIVFTAHEDFDDCIQCIREGADYYLPKVDLKEDRSNIDRLFDHCQTLLYPRSGKSKLDEWLDRYLPELGTRLHGKVFAPIEAAVAEDCKVEGAEFYEDYAILVADEFDQLRKRILGDKALRWLVPPIMAMGRLAEP